MLDVGVFCRQDCAMILWFSIAALIVGACLFVLWPLIRGSAGEDRLAREIAMYEARKVELIRQRDAGEISSGECDAALTEQGRALLALSRGRAATAGDDAGQSARRRKFAALVLLIGVPVLALPIYLRVGAPSLPDVPLAARERSQQQFDVATALQKIETHLAQNPNAARGFEVVAPVYLKAGRYADAARAYSRVIELSGETPERLADLGESLVAEQDGVISAEARQAFERSLKLDGRFAKPKFYLALAREQDGDVAGALADLEKIAAELPESPAKARVSAEIERFRAQDKGPAGPAGPAIANLPPAERETMIRSMVEGLDARLSEKGGTLAEWRQLIQARLVLRQRDAAEVALAKARAALSADPNAGAELEALAAAIKAQPAP